MMGGLGLGRRGRGAWPVREQPSRYGGGTTWNMEREEVLEAAVLSALLASANVRRPSRLHWAATFKHAAMFTCGVGFLSCSFPLELSVYFSVTEWCLLSA